MHIEELYQLYKQHPSVQTDTRKLKKGDLFFALKGPAFDGNQFAQQALEQGAAYAIIDNDASYIDKRTILVHDVLQTLQDLAHYHRQQFSIPFLAITGSNGKTTTKELVHAVLASSFRTYTTDGNLNNHIGVPLTILKIRDDAEMAVIEMGANHQGEIASYCKYADPTHGLITNIGKAHLEGFGGEEGVRKGKGELFRYLESKEGTVFIMSDYEVLQELRNNIQHRFTYGTVDGDIVGHIAATDPYLEVKFDHGFNGLIRTHLVGAYNLPNILAAVAVGTFFGVPPEKIKKAIEGYEPSNSRSQLLRKGKNTVILDAYNANPSSMKAAIENFASLKAAQKVLLLGAMAELGPQSIEEHQDVIDEIAKHQWSQVALVGGDFQKLSHPYLQFTNATEAGAWIKGRYDGASILIKGSRSMQMERILEFL